MNVSEAGRKKRVILLVDDELPIIDAATMMLEAEGFRVYSASSSDEAFAHIGDGVLPDIIITDYRLPGMNGINIIKYVREFLAREVPALVMSGDTSAGAIRAANVANLDVLRKPFQPERLIGQINEALPSSTTNTIPPTLAA